MADRFAAIGEFLREAVHEEVERAMHRDAVETVTKVFPGAAVESDPWAGEPVPPPQQWQQPAPAHTGVAVSQGNGHHPSCQHGPLKVVPGGFSQRTQKAYAPFWACQAPREQQCRLDQRQLPPAPAQ